MEIIFIVGAFALICCAVAMFYYISFVKNYCNNENENYYEEPCFIKIKNELLNIDQISSISQYYSAQENTHIIFIYMNNNQVKKLKYEKFFDAENVFDQLSNVLNTFSIDDQ